MKDVELAAWQHRQLLNHCSAKELDSGWVVLADRNYFDAVLLVSQHRPILRSFVHGEPYHRSCALRLARKSMRKTIRNQLPLPRQANWLSKRWPRKLS